MLLKILYISQYYPPEVNAPAVRVSALSKYWSNLGHQVTVLTGFPNHPSGVVPNEYRGKWLLKEDDNGVTVLRSFVYATPNKGFLRRVLSYLIFMLSSICSGLFRSGKQDVVIATSPQFFVAIAGFIVSRVKRIPFVFEVRDIWPEEIVAVGVLKRGLIVKTLEKIELFLYRQAAKIVVVSAGTVDLLTARGVPVDKIVLLPNGVETCRFRDLPDDHAIRDALSLNGHFLVSYIGTHGMAHNLQTVLRAANRLRHHDDIRFLFVGDGSERDSLLTMQSQFELDNVTFVPQQPQYRIPAYYATSDLCLVPLRRAKLFTSNVPSKVYEIMAAGKPILIGTEGESRRLVERARAGLAYEPDNDTDLAEKILRLYRNRTIAAQFGGSGKDFADTHCQQSVIAQRYSDMLVKLVGRG